MESETACSTWGGYQNRQYQCAILEFHSPSRSGCDVAIASETEIDQDLRKATRFGEKAESFCEQLHVDHANGTQICCYFEVGTLCSDHLFKKACDKNATRRCYAGEGFASDLLPLGGLR